MLLALFEMETLLAGFLPEWGTGVGENWDAAAYAGFSLLVVLVVLWLLARVLRMVVGVLFVLCVAYLVLKLVFGVDAWAYVSPWVNCLLS